MDPRERKQLTLIVSRFNLGCLEYVLKDLKAPDKAPDAATAMTIATAKEVVDQLRSAYDAAKPYNKRSIGEAKRTVQNAS